MKWRKAHSMSPILECVDSDGRVRAKVWPVPPEPWLRGKPQKWIGWALGPNIEHATQDAAKAWCDAQLANGAA